MQTFQCALFCYTFLTQESLIKSPAQSTHPWIGDYRKPTIGFKVDKNRNELLVQKIESKSLMLACLLPPLLAGLLLQSKQVIDFALDAMLVK
jgi:hypothetical protein